MDGVMFHTINHVDRCSGRCPEILVKIRQIRGAKEDAFMMLIVIVTVT